MQSIHTKLTSMLSDILNSDINRKDYELELRFGHKTNNFNPNIGKEMFDCIFNLITKNTFYNITENAYILDKIFDEGILRKFKNMKLNEIMFDKNFFPSFYKNVDKIQKIEKERIYQYTSDYLRISYNKEIEAKFDEEILYPKMERLKYRVSIVPYDIFRFDFTIFNQKEYSVEIELLLEEIESMDHFQKEWEKIIRLLKPAIDIFEQKVIDTIQPQQPHTMTYSDLHTVISNAYTVTEKADGVRAFLKIANNKMQIINPKTGSLLLTLGKSDLNQTLIDGEFVNGRFYAFDAIKLNGKDVRSFNLLKRLEELKKYEKSIPMNIKTFYKDNIFENAKKILDSHHPYQIDGLIFTPIYQQYMDTITQPLPIFKWKINYTIDVRVKYSKREDFTYFIYGKRYGKMNEWSSEYYEREHIRTRDKRTQLMHNAFKRNEYQNIRNKKIHFGKFKVFDDDEITKNITLNGFLGKPGKPNHHHLTEKKLNRELDIVLDKYDIIEYEYRNGEWFPLRKRTFDKDEANAIKTIDSILKVIKEDLSIEKMVEFEQENKIDIEDKVGTMYDHISQDKSFKRENWRNYHNFVKRQVIHKSSYSCIGGSYLDLACGKGGDLGKYMRLGYKNILAIDSSQEELYGKNGFSYRLLNQGFENKGLYYQKDDIKITFVHGDISKPIRNGECAFTHLGKQKIENFFKTTDKFDCISLMFAIHYLFGEFVNNEWIVKDEKINELISNVEDLIKKDGKFIGTYLNTYESNKVDKFSNHGLPFYKIEYLDKTIKISNEVWGWDSIMTEPKINKNKIREHFKNTNLIEIENNSFEEFYREFKIQEGIELSQDEKKLGFLNHYFIMLMSPQKNKSIEL